MHSAPRIWQVQEFPSCHWIPLANQAASDHRFNAPSHKRNQSKSHTPAHTLLSFWCQQAWRAELILRVSEISFPRNFISRPSPHPAEAITCILVVIHFHLEEHELFICPQSKDFWYPDVPLDCCTSLDCCSLETSNQLRGQGLLRSN